MIFSLILTVEVIVEDFSFLQTLGHYSVNQVDGTNF